MIDTEKMSLNSETRSWRNRLEKYRRGEIDNFEQFMYDLFKFKTYDDANQSIKTSEYANINLRTSTIEVCLAHPEKFKKSYKDFALNALEEDAYNYYFCLPDEYKKDKDIVYKAVLSEKEICMLQYVPDEFKSDKELVLKAIENDPSAIIYASPTLQEDEKFLLDAMKCNSEVFEYLEEDAKKVVSKDIETFKMINNVRKTIMENAIKTKETLTSIEVEKKENTSKR